ncbi:MAG: toll/interleukin-1 receptor domain-containing protein [Isosphaeraceae bacterium]
MPINCFLSQSHRDKPFADRLADTLAAHGVETWYSARQIMAADQWHDEIGKALERSDWFLLVLSTSAVNSRWVKRELLYALDEARFVGRITPLLLRPCNWKKLSWTLKAIQWVDFRQDYGRGCQALLQSWGIKYRPPP